jgi:glycogen operon protein
MIAGRGLPAPLGAVLLDGEANFAVFSRHASQVWLLLFEDPAAANPSATFLLDPSLNRTGDIWHIRVAGVTPGRGYLWRADGPWEPESGHRFNRNKALLDPYARALHGLETIDPVRAKAFDPASPLLDLSFSREENVGAMARCLIDNPTFDWGDDRAPHTPWTETVIYETHVRGLTVDPSSGVAHPGAYRGLIEKIPYLKDLGITAIELLPIQEFDTNELSIRHAATESVFRNYWGYNPIALFAVKRSYSSDQGVDGPAREFKEMVKALHAAGIEVILDVVFNHTAEGNELGPSLSFRGLDNSIYYLLDDDKRYYKDFTGCKNTLNCNHPIVRQYILDCLHFWVVEMHVDGFRFDLASILGRDEAGVLERNPPVLERIAEDPILHGVKLIAEPWDAAGAYQLGAFPDRWAEWNGRYRDDVRRFWRGDAGMAGIFATRFCGSADIYQPREGSTIRSINFITSHDGFTLNDVVSYARKHNEQNGEANRDGWDEEVSFNLGVEGETGDIGIQRMRLRQIRSFLTSLLLSRGVPMLLGGDEFRRTQWGNNNAYCQDNAISWYDWRLADRNAGLVDFCRSLLAFRRRHPVLRNEGFYAAAATQWFGADGQPPAWNAGATSFGLNIRAADSDGGRDYALCLIFNAADIDVVFQVPTAPGAHHWLIALNTAEDFVPATGEEPAVAGDQISIGAKAVVALLSKPSA